MKKNQAIWMKWYLANTGKEWDEEDAGKQPDLSGLSPKDADLGALLYRRYVAEVQDAEKLAYDNARTDAVAYNRQKEVEATAARLKRYTDETALAQGQKGTSYARQRNAAVSDSARKGIADAGDTLTTKEKLLDAYAKQRDRRDKQLSQDVDDTYRRYEVLERNNWQSLRESLGEQLADHVSEFDTKTYTPEGIAAVKQAIRQNRDKLGDMYDEAMRWADELPVYKGRTDGKMLYNGSKRVFVSNQELSYADAVTYEGGAGAKLTDLDVAYVQYKDKRYVVKPTQDVTVATKKMLNAIAEDKGMHLTKGATIYYQNNLYINDGQGTWYGTRNLTAHTISGNLTALLAAIEEDMKQEHKED